MNTTEKTTQLIINEIENFSKKENFKFTEDDVRGIIAGVMSNLKKIGAENQIAESETTINNSVEGNFEKVNPVDYKEEKVEEIKPIETIQTVKHLSEELKRMKHLVDFRSPLLTKDAQ